MVDNEEIYKTFYHLNRDADPADFWVKNGYVKDSFELIREAIVRGDQGFRGGWVESNKVVILTGLGGLKVPSVLVKMGYTLRGRIKKQIFGTKTVYSLDPSADFADFWRFNYEQ